MSGRLLDAHTIAAELAGCIDSFCLEFLPAGRLEGGEWRVGSIAGEPGRSMAVHIGGPRAGVWCDFGGPDDHRGDALDLAAQVLFRGDKGKAMAWARAWLGLDQIDPKSFEVRRAAAVAKKAKAQRQDDDLRGAAKRIYLGARPSLAGTPVAHYLAGRGTDLAALGRQPRCLRYADALWNEESKRKWPAMVAAISSAAGELVAVHRTWLHWTAAGVTKAPLIDAKMTLGRYVGGCIRLWRGASGKPLREAPAGEWAVIAEGIEDGLTAVTAAPELRVLVAVSLSNMGSLELPAAIAGVTLLAHNDTAPAAIAARDRAVAHFLDMGKRVRLAKPPVYVKDVNELAQRELEPTA